jgi:4-alpha-glucanotransferase
MNHYRTSGILLHVTSLPGGQGVGDFGPAAYRFVDFLARSRQGVWQVLPLGPPCEGASPYQCFSAFAGNPLLVSLDELANRGLLAASDLPPAEAFERNRVDFARVTELHRRLLEKAFAAFESKRTPKELRALADFAEQHQSWLDDYALFRALNDAHDGAAWNAWPAAIRAREPQALAAWREKLARAVELEKFVQYEFFRQWHALKKYANDRGIEIIGDLPIFVAHDSADVWANQELFALEPDGRPSFVAGVPPDYFSKTGQLWGNPLYRWDRMAERDYDWWTKRVRGSMELFDRIRLDHFRGFEAYWEVPGAAKVAAVGRWAPGPGAALFAKLEKKLGKLPIIAEDLGEITPAVEAIRDQFDYPGMRVLQFAFGDDPLGIVYQPHNYIRNAVAYTGTHDNDTVVGWFSSQQGEGTTRPQDRIDAERAFTLRYLHSDGKEIHWDFIRAALASVAATAIFPLQDLLGLGTAARMNMPGTAIGNWAWRFTWDELTPTMEARLKEMSATYQREPRQEPATMGDK